MTETLQHVERYPGFPQLECLEPGQFPQHVLIIPDGNRTWAKLKGLPTEEGHAAGLENSIKLLRGMRKLPIQYVSLWGFSHDNNKRGSEEKANLMGLFAQGLHKHISELITENVRFKALGDLSTLPDETREAFLNAESASSENTGQVVSVLVNFSGTDQERRINQATALRIASLVRENPDISDEALLELTSREWVISQRDGAGEIPPADLLIRTKQSRTSDVGWLNGPSTTLYTRPDILFPDLSTNDVADAILLHAGTEHNFGV